MSHAGTGGRLATSSEKPPFIDRFLNAIEVAGNKLPDPAMLFVYCLLIVVALSAVFSSVSFDLVSPATGEAIQVKNLLDAKYLTDFMASSVTTFTSFAPLGMVLAALLGVGIAESSGYINIALKKMIRMTPQKLLAPAVVMIGAISSVAADAGYVLVIPIGAVIFHAAGRHPLAGLAAAFAGVSGGFSAGFLPSSLDPLLQSFTQSAAQIYDKDYLVNPLANFYFTFVSTFVVTLLGWFVTEKIVEPRLKSVELNKDLEEAEDMSSYTQAEDRAFKISSAVLLAMAGLLVLACLPETSPLRAENGSLTAHTAPLMKSIVPLILLFFLIPGVIYGRMTGTFKNHRDVMAGMSQSMTTMSSYIVMAFFCAQFLKAFGDSNLGTLLALSGAEVLQAMDLPGQMTIIGIILLTAVVNLTVGSASAKWALIGPIFVPMLMAVGISPELSQAAYRIGDSSSNIITPMMAYYPVIIVFCQRYVKNSGIGTIASLMMPYSIVFLVGWTAFLLLYWALGLPLGIAAPYTYPVM
ncbi:AbgT family transporter [Endozoicomonas numazuensis]|uniref:Aminobenzoyl-glutamate transporter n=1 Tax=Endozoicomonas numazuensis TaxID=1137799 RepID=A0A081NJC6_9GAMM|nr:AbgT family transporter [Endozoicomonas numazuensis]KEQ18549.1 aminobenzoyl-glutamate transporter [Endozoicomonas numazuensis]